MENENIIHFLDFVKNTNFDKPLNIEENLEIQVIPELTELEFSEEKLEKIDKLMSEVDLLKEEVNSILKENTILETELEAAITPIDTEDFYILYNDKNENFSCEVMVEGANLNKTEARLIVETNDWTLMFEGEIDRAGRCNIPIKKLNILEEGTIGKIKLEVIAEGNIFVPWEDDFKVIVSKKVSVKMNETKNGKPTKTDVKVKF